ncbi:MAG: hypothetical protein ACYC0V_16280 [Armatimonadota bacterium]
MKKRKIITIIAAMIVMLIVICIILLFIPSSKVGSPIKFKSDEERIELATGLNQRAISFESAMRSRTASRASLDIDERELNAYLQVSPEIKKKLQDIGAKDVIIRLHKDQMLVGMKVPYNGILFPASAVIDIKQDLDRKLKVKITDVKIGSLPAPNSLVDAITKGSLKNGSVDLPPGIINLEVGEGKVIVQANPASIQSQ